MAFGDILLTSANRIYRYSNGSWDSGFAGPSGEIALTGVAVDPTNGNIVVVGTTRGRIYRHSSGSWDSGFTGPSGETSLADIAFDSETNDILVVGFETDKVYRYSNGSWDSGLDILSLEDFSIGLAINSITNNIFITGISTRNIYKYINGAWVFVAEGPPPDTATADGGASSVVVSGLTFDFLTNDILVAGRYVFESRFESGNFVTDYTNKVYRYSNGSWDSGFATPSGVVIYSGIAYDAYGKKEKLNEAISITDSVATQLIFVSEDFYENITIRDSIGIQVVYGSEATQQEFNLLSRWYTTEPFNKTWLIPESERPTINTKLTPNGETRELVKVEVTIFGTLVLNLSSDISGSVTQGGDDLSRRFESEGHAKINASNHSVIFSVADSLDFEEPYVLENRIPGNALFNALSTVDRRESGKLTISDGDIVEIINIDESINIHEAVVVGKEIEELENISINEEVNIHILKNLSEDIGILENIILDANKHISENISIQELLSIQLARNIRRNIAENISIQDLINVQAARNISKNISENIRIQDGIATLTFESDFDLDRFNKVGLNIFALALITSGTPEGNGTVFKVSNNLGSVSADSDLEVTDNRDITQIALEIQGAGNIRIWDTPGTLDWGTFFAANPTVTLRVQFSSAGPAYELTRGNQGGNFSSWSTSNTDARTAIHNARAEGQKFILALASPGLDRNTNLAEQINIQELLTIRLPGQEKIDEQINIQDLVGVQLSINRNRAEQISIQDLINVQLIRNINRDAVEQISIQDLIHTRLIRDVRKAIRESIRIRDAVNVRLIIPILKTIRDSIRIQDVVDTQLSRTAFWPQALPNELSRVGYAESPTDNVSRFKTTYGSGSRRPRYTSTPVLYTGTILLNPAEYAIFRDFYFNVLKAGSKDFIFPQLLLSQNIFVRFTSKPNRRREGKNWRVTLQLRTI